MFFSGLNNEEKLDILGNRFDIRVRMLKGKIIWYKYCRIGMVTRIDNCRFNAIGETKMMIFG